MTTTRWLKILNPVIFLLTINQILTGLNGRSLTREGFEFFHEYTGLALGALVLVHLALNWNWVRAQYFKRRK